MLKFLLLAAVLLWLFYSPAMRNLLRGLRGDEPQAPSKQASSKAESAPAGPVAMVPCAHCGVHLPSHDALLNDVGQPFCSEAHRQAGPRRH